MMDYVDENFINNPAIKQIRVCNGLGLKNANKTEKTNPIKDLKNQKSF